jgi:hypothetical protein
LFCGNLHHTIKTNKLPVLLGNCFLTELSRWLRIHETNTAPVAIHFF